MDITLIENNNKFIYRVSAIMLNNDLSKILLVKEKDSDFYLLPGGNVKMFEESDKAIERKIKEETGFDNIYFYFLGISEEFVKDGGYNNHQINIIYKGVYKENIEDNMFLGIDGGSSYEWIDIDNLDNYNVFPENTKKMVKKLNVTHHNVENLLAEEN